MAKLVQKMPEVAYCVLSKSVSCEGHCDDKGFVKRYDFLCLQSRLPGMCHAISLLLMTFIMSCNLMVSFDSKGESWRS